MTGKNTKHRCKQLRKLHQATLDPTIPGYTGIEAEGSHREAVNNMIGLLFRCMEYSNSSDIQTQDLGNLDGQTNAKAELLLTLLGMSTWEKAETSTHVSSGAQEPHNQGHLGPVPFLLPRRPPARHTSQETTKHVPKLTILAKTRRNGMDQTPHLARG